MSVIDYESEKGIRKVIQQLIWLERMAERGDTVAASVVMDVKASLGFYGGNFMDVLTPRQRQAIVGRFIEDKNQSEVADELNISQPAVHKLIKGGIRRIKEYLKTGKIVKAGEGDG